MWWLRLLFDLAALAGWARCVLVVLSRPASRFAHGWFSKLLWLGVAVSGTSLWGGLVLPLGAGVVWWRLVVRGRDRFELPMADGQPMR